MSIFCEQHFFKYLNIFRKHPDFLAHEQYFENTSTILKFVNEFHKKDILKNSEQLENTNKFSKQSSYEIINTFSKCEHFLENDNNF